MTAVRTRFAPSPTGYIHVGGIRTALFAWLVARQNKGQFILRLEDTDQKREVEGAQQHLIDSLIALGLDYDEGPGKGGEYGPYVQSQRLEIYLKWAKNLVSRGLAYADPYDQATIEEFRQKARADGRPYLYRNQRPASPPMWDGSRPLRFKSNPKAYAWHDEVMGDLNSGAEAIDDFVLIKSDGFPTYNFAHIIDDFEMKISHVLRGQEFISSQPNYLNLYEALEITPPHFATLPHVLAPGGQRKLSKRDGAKDVLEYIEEGYMSEALISFIATLGWNDGTTQEIFTLDELLQKFDLNRVQKAGANFDQQRLNWLNGTLIRRLSLEELYIRVKDRWPSEAESYDEGYKKRVLSLIQERLKYFGELRDLSLFFFKDLRVDPDLISSHKLLSKYSSQELKNLLEVSRAKLAETEFTPDDLTKTLNLLLEQTNTKPAVLFSLIRIATTQAPASPGLSETLAVLGKDRSLERMDRQIATL